MSCVIDTSLTIAWVYEDERTGVIERLLDFVHREGAQVPAIWRLEVANALQQGVKQRRIDGTRRADALSMLAAMNISIDSQTNHFAWTDTLQLADRFKLTSYDASYLELAQRRGLPLAALDKELLSAGKKLGIPLL